jgi:RHS repeat-associated protein
MPVTSYYSVGGELLGEETAGARRDYLTDALGSVTALVDSTAAVLNTYRYKPYGSQLSKTGTASDPLFTWVGSQGYRQTGKSYSDVYVRARHYDNATGRWTTQDPFRYEDGWNPFAYAQNSAVLVTDPSGRLCKYKVMGAYCGDRRQCYINPPWHQWDRIKDCKSTLESRGVIAAMCREDSKHAQGGPPPRGGAFETVHVRCCDLYPPI